LDLVTVARRLRDEVGRLDFAVPTSHVYCPLTYAWDPHETYVRRYGAGPKAVLLVGMNPGPFGMAQTGVPFGDVAMVRDYLEITGRVDRPRGEHPKRPVLGFACPRREVSGTRLWGWVRSRFPAPTDFFARCFVVNYCPLLFLEASGRNRTPDQLPVDERDPLLAACDQALRDTVEVLRPSHVVGIGSFAADRARNALRLTGTRVATVLHPSPASPRANRGWAEAAEQDLARAGIRL
jgi:single-strand selective monofunctional uracil DNA glycosylase